MHHINSALYIGQKSNAYRVMLGKHKGKTPLRRPKQTQNNIKMDLKETSSEAVDCINDA
jgi:hypothetical protein